VSLYRDQGVVLRTMRLGEADRIVTMVTREHGKVRAVAKGVRRTTSKFGGRLEPLSHVVMMCWAGRELDIINQAEVIDSFRAIRENLGRVQKAYSMLEVVDQLSMERHVNPRMYDMLVGGLRVLATTDPPLMPAAFFLKAVALDGASPILDVCVSCGSDSGLVAFDIIEGGVLCRSCRRGRPVSPGALDLIRRILGGSLGSALAEPAGEVVGEVSDLAGEAIELHLDRRLRSLRTVSGSW
jgi:DNA repair protein RecO (recombination protein O)